MLTLVLLAGNLRIHTYRRTTVVSERLSGRICIFLPNQWWHVSLDRSNLTRKIKGLSFFSDRGSNSDGLDFHHGVNQPDLCAKLHGSHRSLPCGHDDQSMADIPGIPSPESYHGRNCDLGESAHTCTQQVFTFLSADWVRTRCHVVFRPLSSSLNCPVALQSDVTSSRESKEIRGSD
jgi:hypothetical protein